MLIFPLFLWSKLSKILGVCFWFKTVRFSLTIFEVGKLRIKTDEYRGWIPNCEFFKLRTRWRKLKLYFDGFKKYVEGEYFG